MVKNFKIPETILNFINNMDEKPEDNNIFD